jgi:Na+/H+ antiporter NhaD/arsenite permease-like protein
VVYGRDDLPVRSKNRKGYVMRRFIQTTCIVLLTLLVGFGSGWAADPKPANPVLILQGKILDSAESPLGDATIIPYLNGKPYRPAINGTHSDKDSTTGRNGLFMMEISAPADKIKDGKWEIKVTRPSFKPSEVVPLKISSDGVDDKGVAKFVTSTTVQMKRFQGTAFWIALVVFLVVYALIAFEVVHRTLAAFLGAATLLLITHTLGTFDERFVVLTYEQAIHAIDWNVILLLLAMMIIVGVLKISGVFQWLAYKSFQIAGGRIFLLASALCVVTAVTSAFLDNVTTMLLVLGISPFVFLIPQILASNFGGTATLIGDPPNIMIGSYAGLTFNDFVFHLTPIVLVVMVAQIIYNRYYYGAEYHKGQVEDVPKMMAFLKEKYKITDAKVLTVGGIVLLGTIAMFIAHGWLHMQVSVAALFGAALVVLLCKIDIVEMLEKEVEWPSLVFFMTLFIVVGAAEQTGILQVIADWILDVCQGRLWIATLLILWISGFTSAIVDNIPYTATLLPITMFLTKTMPGADSGVLWWALSLGACFGGNGTIIGASANVVTTGIMEKAGYKVTFYQFMKQAAPITLISLVLSSLFLLLRY